MTSHLLSPQLLQPRSTSVYRALLCYACASGPQPKLVPPSSPPGSRPRHAGYATGAKPGTVPSGPRKSVKVKINQKEPGAATVGGPDPGRLVNPEYLTKNPINLSPIPDLPTFEASNVGQLFKFTSRALKAFEIFSVPSSIAADVGWTAMDAFRVPFIRLTSKYSIVSISVEGYTDPDDDHAEGSKFGAATSADLKTPGVAGAKGSGKSTVMLQAVSYALHKGWIVLYIPDVKSVVDGQYSYEYCPKNQIYHQNSLSASILNTLSLSDLGGLALRSGQRLFGTKDERLVEAPELLGPGIPLTTLIQLGTAQPHFAPIVLESVLGVLANQSLRPVLIALDGAQNLFRPSGYKDSNFRELDSFVLNVPRALLRFARGSERLTKGLTVLAGSSLDHSSQSLAWDLTVIEGKPPTGYIWPGWAAYSQLAAPIHAFPRLKVGMLELEEATGIAKGLQITKQFIGPLSDRVFVRHLIASGGNAREFRREIRFQTAL